MSQSSKDPHERLDEHEHKLSLLEQWRKHVEEAAHEDRLSRLEKLLMKATYTVIGALALFALENIGLKGVIQEIFK